MRRTVTEAAREPARHRRRRHTAGEATRLSLIRTAERLFAERGIEGVTLREIQLAAGQSSSSAITYHFGSKRSLVRAIVEYRQGRLDRERARMAEQLRADEREPSHAASPGGRTAHGAEPRSPAQSRAVRGGLCGLPLPALRESQGSLGVLARSSRRVLGYRRHGTAGREDPARPPRSAAQRKGVPAPLQRDQSAGRALPQRARDR